MRYTRRDWRNRNRIKTQHGLAWLTIPVRVKGGYFDQKIRDTVVSDPGWNRLHWKTLVHSYSKARYFNTYRDLFADLYFGATEAHLSCINRRFLSAICGLLGIRTKLSSSMDYSLIEGKTERIVHLCRQAGATEYVSGPTARAYLDERLLREAGIAIQYMSYSGYPEYRQLNPPFEHAVSIVDLIFNEGPNATQYMITFR